MKLCMLLQPSGLLKLMISLFSTIDAQGRELFVRDFLKYTINIGLCETLVYWFVSNLV